METLSTLFRYQAGRPNSTLALAPLNRNQLRPPLQKRKILVLGIKLDKTMRRQVIYGYIGLCVLTAVSFVNYYLIQNHDDSNLDYESDVIHPRRHRETRNVRNSRNIRDHRNNFKEHQHNNENHVHSRDTLEQPIPEPIQESKQENSNSINKNNGPVKNIYYVKVHKAGSTTLQNIMFRYAMKNDVRVAIFNRPWGMPYPEYAKPEFLYENITDSQFEKYNLICDHSVYDRQSVAPFMEDNYESIAILREPYSHLVSAFDFWGLAKRFRLHRERDPLREFLTKDPNQYKDIIPHFNRTKNMQAYHFGHTDYHDNSEESIIRLIKHVDKHFKLILLRERFEESLVLMRRIFKWNFEDILYMDQFVNTQPKAKLRTERQDENLRLKHKQFARVDYRLYEHFSEKLTRMIESESNDLLGEVLYFKETNRKVAEFCENVCNIFPFESIKNLTVEQVRSRLKEGIVFPANSWHEEMHLTYEHCAYMKFWTYQYHNAFRVKQLPASCAEFKDVGPAVAQAQFDPHDVTKYGYCDKSKRVVFNFPLDVFKEIVLDVPMHPVTNAKIAKSPKCKARQ